VEKILLSAPTPSIAMKPAGAWILNAYVNLLPDWAIDTPVQKKAGAVASDMDGTGVKMTAPLMRWALNNGVSKRARRRVAMKPD
jgi:hypothetical protein